MNFFVVGVLIFESGLLDCAMFLVLSKSNQKNEWLQRLFSHLKEKGQTKMI